MSRDMAGLVHYHARILAEIAGRRQIGLKVRVRVRTGMPLSTRRHIQDQIRQEVRQR